MSDRNRGIQIGTRPGTRVAVYTGLIMGMKAANRWVRRPAILTDASNTALRDKRVVLTGALTTMKRREVATRLASLGAHIDSSVTNHTDILIAGDKAIVPGAETSAKMRRALASDRIEIWSEGDLLELLSPERKPLDQLFPSSANLRILEPTDSGELEVPEVPRKRRLTLRWQAVPFVPNRKFAEDWGMEFSTHEVYLGQFFYKGEPLTVEPGGEHFRYCRFAEDGSDYAWDSKLFDGRGGVNVSWLIKEIRRDEPMRWRGDALELSAEHCFGAIIGHERETYTFDFQKKTLSWKHDWAPNDMDR